LNVTRHIDKVLNKQTSEKVKMNRFRLKAYNFASCYARKLV